MRYDLTSVLVFFLHFPVHVWNDVVRTAIVLVAQVECKGGVLELFIADSVRFCFLYSR